MARPTKYTPERAERIIRDVRAGQSHRAAAEANGIDRGTLENWQQRYSTFATAIREADGYAERAIAGVIIKAAVGNDTRAAEFWLRTRRREDWSEKQAIEHTGRDGGPIEHATIELSDSERAARVAALLDAARARGTG